VPEYIEYGTAIYTIVYNLQPPYSNTAVFNGKQNGGYEMKTDNKIRFPYGLLILGSLAGAGLGWSWIYGDSLIYADNAYNIGTAPALGFILGLLLTAVLLFIPMFISTHYKKVHWGKIVLLAFFSISVPYIPEWHDIQGNIDIIRLKDNPSITDNDGNELIVSVFTGQQATQILKRQLVKYGSRTPDFVWTFGAMFLWLISLIWAIVDKRITDTQENKKGKIMKKSVLLSFLFLAACSTNIRMELFEEPIPANPGKGQAILLYDGHGTKLYKYDAPKNKKCKALGYIYASGEQFCFDQCRFEAVAKAIYKIGGNTGVWSNHFSPFADSMNFNAAYCE
jgi:hypothetical protein